MNLRNFASMDPNLLVGLVNTNLRNDCADLEDLVKTHDIEQSELEAKLKEIGYQYESDLNRFVQISTK